VSKSDFDLNCGVGRYIRTGLILIDIIITSLPSNAFLEDLSNIEQMHRTEARKTMLVKKAERFWQL
jgi:hypothetical protein